MTARFLIRKQRLMDGPRWTIRDALCRNCESHNFDDQRWVLYCWGECDDTKFFSSAIGKVAALIEIDHEVPEWTDEGVTK